MTTASYGDGSDCNNGPAPRTGSISFEAVATYGNQEGDGTLYIPLDVAVDRERHVYVLDHDAGTIRQFTSDGAYLESIGRRV